MGRRQVMHEAREWLRGKDRSFARETFEEQEAPDFVRALYRLGATRVEVQDPDVMRITLPRGRKELIQLMVVVGNKWPDRIVLLRDGAAIKIWFDFWPGVRSGLRRGPAVPRLMRKR